MGKDVDDAKVMAMELLCERELPFRKLMMQYECAMLEVKTKIEVLNKEMSVIGDRNPFETVVYRLKSPSSIVGKLKRLEEELNVENMETKLNDIAGIRIICSFPDDIYRLVDFLVNQDDIILLDKKDYIRNPKVNGYRSLHLILDVPIFLSDEKKHMKVEVQFRTIAMDFWASLEHKLRYKKDMPDSQRLTDELKDCADLISDLDHRMNNIRCRIDEKMF